MASDESDSIITLPVAGDDFGAAAGACLEGDPNCNDTGGDMAAPPPPLDDEEPSDGVVSQGMTVDGGLTVSQALASDAAGIIAVQGFLFDDGSGARLCEVLMESFPPQCGQPSLPVSNYEEAVDVPIQSNQGVSWTDSAVTFFGEIIDGELIVDPTVTG